MFKYLTLASILLASSAFAGEKFLGTIVSAAGADTTNGTTAVPFLVPTGQTITIQCNAAAFVITDDTVAVTTLRGLNLSTNQIFLTSTSNQEIIVISSQVSAIVRVGGAGAVSCSVWTNRGNE
jgi:hypothetical protein